MRMNSICPRPNAVWLTWLAGGLIACAASPDTGSKDHASRFTNHWSFVAPQQPTIPKVKNTQRSGNPIDAFVLARLEKDNFAPSPEADRVTMLPPFYDVHTCLGPPPGGD